MDVRARLERLRGVLASLETRPEALLVTSLTNIRYLTGFTGSAGLLFVLPGLTAVVTDGRYATQAGEQLDAAGVDARVVVARAPDQVERARELVTASAIRGLALEAAHVSWDRQRSFAEDWFPGVELIPTVGLVEGLRRVKDPGELARLAEAARIADAALDRLRPELAAGADRGGLRPEP